MVIYTVPMIKVVKDKLSAWKTTSQKFARVAKKYKELFLVSRD